MKLDLLGIVLYAYAFSLMSFLRHAGGALATAVEIAVCAICSYAGRRA